MTRTILHIDMDAFFVSVEETLDPSLCGKPVVVGGDPNGRGVVAAASYAARRFGIHSAMPVAAARRLCPDAIFLRGSHRRYSEMSEQIFRIMEQYSPSVEPMSLDEAYLDLTGCELLHGPTLNTAERIRDKIKDTVGINASIGIASNKLIAKIASGYAKPSGMLWIPEGKERRFLAPLPIGSLPGVGPKGGKQLQRMGIRTVNDLTNLPRQLLEDAFQKWGTALYLKARGVCHSEVEGRSDARSISRETTFEEDTLDLEFLESALSYLVEKASAQLREDAWGARCISLKLRYSDFQTVTRSQTLDEATNEDYVIYQTTANLLRCQLNQRRTRIRLIGVALTRLGMPGPVQADLFAALDPRQWDQLYQGIDRIRDKYGFHSILRGRTAIQRDLQIKAKTRDSEK